MRLRRLWKNTEGSSLISVLVAFIILLIGIAGFARAVRTANDMVRRAEMLNTATGKMLCGDGAGVSGFYASYADEKILPSNYKGIPVYETDKDGNIIGSEAFEIHCQPRTREYTVSITDAESGKEPDKITYQMYFYK